MSIYQHKLFLNIKAQFTSDKCIFTDTKCDFLPGYYVLCEQENPRELV